MQPADVRCRRIPHAVPHLGAVAGDYAVQLPDGTLGTFHVAEGNDADLIRRLLDDEALAAAAGDDVPPPRQSRGGPPSPSGARALRLLD